MELETRILNAKKENPLLGFKRIAKLVGCSHNNVKYHLLNGVKANTQKKRIELYHIRLLELRHMFGGKCKKCGYDKCMSALEFHHIDRKTKKGSVVKLLRNSSYQTALNEAKKCELICANCHRELHEMEGVSGAAPDSSVSETDVIADIQYP